IEELLLNLRAVLRKIVNQPDELGADYRYNRKQDQCNDPGNYEVQCDNAVGTLHPASSLQTVNQRIQQIVGDPGEKQRRRHGMQQNRYGFEDKRNLGEYEYSKTNQQHD
ncbi:hypothetical protein KC345_g12162, partial [Hortaea werneckii]